MKKFSSVSLVFSLFALASGVVNGLLGTGGGILLTYALAKALPRTKYSPKDVFVCSMTAVIPISVFSLFTYPPEMSPSLTVLLGIVLPAAAGGIFGAVLSAKLKSVIVEKAFALLIVYAGVRMLIRIGGIK